MPPGFGLLDTALVSVPIFLMLLGLIRGAPVELASCCGCAAGVASAWLVSCLPPFQALGQPGAPLVALMTGLAAWWLARGVSHRFGFDTRWIDFGRLFDSVTGGVMGGIRGLAIVSTGCLSYAVICVPLGLANPIGTAAYPVFLTLGANVTHAVMEASEPVAIKIADAITPVPAPVHAALPAAPPPLPTANGPALAALIHVIAPEAAAASSLPLPLPLPVPRADSPVRGIPVSLMETHHNILHPFGMLRRRSRR